MINLILILVLAFTKAAMDILASGSKVRIFNNFKSSFFAQTNVSWKRKYKNGEVSKGEAFLFSTTLLVWLTDAWHFLGLINILTWFALVYSSVHLVEYQITLFDLLFMFVFFLGNFEMFYRILKAKIELNNTDVFILIIITLALGAVGVSLDALGLLWLWKIHFILGFLGIVVSFLISLVFMFKNIKK